MSGSDAAGPDRVRAAAVPWHARAAARLRVPLLFGGLLLLVLAVAGSLVVDDSPRWWLLPGAVSLVAGFALYFLVGTMDRPPVVLGPPVTGRWSAVNSPSTRAPSHGTQAWGQTYAVDLVHTPMGPYAPRYGWGRGIEPPESFSGFGRPVLAPVDGTVVRVHDGSPDHGSRTSWPAVGLMMLEAGAREARGPSGLLGNHVVIAADAGAHVVLAHLRCGSVTVGRGELVRAGQQIAECGNSGNTSEPHLHIHVQDLADPAFAAGLPMAFEGVEVEAGGEGRVPGIPRNGAALRAPDPGASTA